MAQVQKNEDIAPSLIKAVQDAVNANVRSNQRLANLRGLIGEGRATYKDMAEYAREYGKMVKRAMASNVSSAVLPDGKMYWNIADRLFDQIMTQEFSEISQHCEQVQTALNQAAGLGIKAQVPELDPDKIKGLKEYASRADQYDNVKASVENALVTYSQSIVDESVKKNADFQAKSGMHPRIIRSAAPGCCRWCTMLAGSYDYPEDTPDDVFKRHANCNCVVEYYPGDGKRQNVWTKVWRTEQKNENHIKKQADIVKDYNSLGRREVLNSWEEYRKKFLGKATPITEDSFNDSMYKNNVIMPTGKPKLCEQMINTFKDLNRKYYSPLDHIEPMSKQESALSTAFADTYHSWEVGSCTIRYNPLKVGDKGVNRIKELSSKGWMAKIKDGDEIRYVVTHEYGHAIINIGEKLPGKSRNFVETDFKPYWEARKELQALYDEYLKDVENAKKAYDDYRKPIEMKFINGIAPTPEEKKRMDQLKQEYENTIISKYSLSSADEFVAEGFADAEVGTNPSKYSQRVQKIIKKHFGKE